jgi:hypothetical protein
MAPTQPAVAPDLDLLLRANRRAMSERQSEGMQSVQNAFRHLTVENSSEAASIATSAPAGPGNMTRERNEQSRIVLGRALDVADGIELNRSRLTVPPNAQVGQSSAPDLLSFSPINTSRYTFRCPLSSVTS